MRVRESEEKSVNEENTIIISIISIISIIIILNLTFITQSILKIKISKKQIYYNTC